MIDCTPASNAARTHDSDGDRLTDYDEVCVFHTDPQNQDTDGDGMRDGDEVAQGRNPSGPGMLKDFFIPHAGNNFRPRSLSRGHLLTHALMALFLKGLILFCIIVLPSSALLAPDALIEHAQRIVTLTNAIRESLALRPVAVNEQLQRAASGKAADMASAGYFSHTGPDDKRVTDWVRASGYSFSVAGENLAVGFATPEGVVSGWTKSRTHYANIIDPDYTDIGIGVALGTYKDKEAAFVAQFFGAPKTLMASEPILEKPPIPAVLTAEKKGNAILLKASAQLPPSTELARVYFDTYEIGLQPSPTAPEIWEGAVLADVEREYTPLVLPTLVTASAAGTSELYPMEIEDIAPLTPTVHEKYSYLKRQSAPFLSALFSLSFGYYGALIILLIISLMLNTLIEIRKQHPEAIFSCVALIVLVGFLLTF